MKLVSKFTVRRKCRICKRWFRTFDRPGRRARSVVFVNVRPHNSVTCSKKCAGINRYIR